MFKQEKTIGGLTMQNGAKGHQHSFKKICHQKTALRPS
jgi:hypothetical protein